MPNGCLKVRRLTLGKYIETLGKYIEIKVGTISHLG